MGAIVDIRQNLCHNTFVKPAREWIFKEKSFFATQSPEGCCVVFYRTGNCAPCETKTLREDTHLCEKKGMKTYGPNFYEREKNTAIGTIHVTADGTVYGCQFTV